MLSTPFMINVANEWKVRGEVNRASCYRSTMSICSWRHVTLHPSVLDFLIKIFHIVPECIINTVTEHIRTHIKHVTAVRLLFLYIYIHRPMLRNVHRLSETQTGLVMKSRNQTEAQTTAWKWSPVPNGDQTMLMYQTSRIRGDLGRGAVPSLRPVPGGGAWVPRWEWLRHARKAQQLPQDQLWWKPTEPVGVFGRTDLLSKTSCI